MNPFKYRFHDDKFSRYLRFKVKTFSFEKADASFKTGFKVFEQMQLLHSVINFIEMFALVFSSNFISLKSSEVSEHAVRNGSTNVSFTTSTRSTLKFVVA